MKTEYPANVRGRTVIDSIGYQSSGWWVGVVHDTVDQTGESRIRLERATQNRGGGWKSNQSWRVHPDYWDAEKTAVEKIKRGGGKTNPRFTPTYPSIKVKRYLKVRKDDQRWVAAVRVYNENRNKEQTRLYHWDVPSDSCLQTWTVGPDWPKVIRLATRHVTPTV